MQGANCTKTILRKKLKWQFEICTRKFCNVKEFASYWKDIWELLLAYLWYLNLIMSASLSDVWVRKLTKYLQDCKYGAIRGSSKTVVVDLFIKKIHI